MYRRMYRRETKEGEVKEGEAEHESMTSGACMQAGTIATEMKHLNLVEQRHARLAPRTERQKKERKACETDTGAVRWKEHVEVSETEVGRG